MPQAVGQTACRARWRALISRDLRRPKGPKVSVLASSSFRDLHDQLSDPSGRRLVSSDAPDRPALLERATSIPPIAFSRHCSSRKISNSPTGVRQKLHRLVDAFARIGPWLRATGIAGYSSPSGRCIRQSQATGENVDGEISPSSFTTGPSTATLLLKIIGPCPGRLGHLRLSQILLHVRKEIGSRSQAAELRMVMVSVAVAPNAIVGDRNSDAVTKSEA